MISGGSDEQAKGGEGAGHSVFSDWSDDEDTEDAKILIQPEDKKVSMIYEL